MKKSSTGSRKTKTPALAAALSMLSASLGVSVVAPARAEGARQYEQSDQLKSANQLKLSNQLKLDQLKQSDQLKYSTPQKASNQIKLDQEAPQN